MLSASPGRTRSTIGQDTVLQSSDGPALHPPRAERLGNVSIREMHKEVKNKRLLVATAHGSHMRPKSAGSTVAQEQSRGNGGVQGPTCETVAADRHESSDQINVDVR